MRFNSRFQITTPKHIKTKEMVCNKALESKQTPFFKSTPYHGPVISVYIYIYIYIHIHIPIYIYIYTHISAYVNGLLVSHALQLEPGEVPVIVIVI